MGLAADVSLSVRIYKNLNFPKQVVIKKKNIPLLP